MSTEPDAPKVAVSADAPAGRPRRGNSRGSSQGKSPDNSRTTKRGDSRGAQGQSRVSRKELDAAAAMRTAVDLPPIIYPEALPVCARREDIAAAIRDHQVVIVAGETGSGKTTQIPKIALDLGRGRTGQIGHTQPRRIAARSVAERIAEELNTELGDVVGYQVRFTDTSSERTLVKVMTDGILLAQIQRDPELLAYDTLIIDEAHERSLNIDFLLGYLTNLLPRRPDLKIIITSATIDSARFARHFAPGGPIPFDSSADPDADPSLADASPAPTSDRAAAPVIEVTGRMFPVDILYRPLEGETKADEKDMITGIVDACDELMTHGNGDVLVFLSGEREIRDTSDALESHLGPRARDTKHPRHVEILPLYSRLSAADQHKVFARHHSRRIVLATNVAETSLTVPGIHYVVDPGTARISRYSKATKVQRLPIEPISQASANQRSGRAGRLADGVAIRLYSSEDFESRDAFTEPEILRTSLASVLLHMISVGVVSSPADVAKFPFVEPPETRAIRDGVNLLTELGAVTTGAGVHARTNLTAVGRKLARLPIDPRHARMIVEGARHGVARDVTIIAAALSIQDPRERPSEQRESADRHHARFADPASDLLSYLNLWEYLRERQHTLSGSAFRRACRAEHLNFLRVREWQDLVEQIRHTARPLGIDIRHRPPTPADASGKALSKNEGSVSPATDAGANDRRDGPGSIRHAWNEEAIHRSLLAGLLSHLGMQDTGTPKASAFAHLKGSAREAVVRRASKQARNDYLGARGARFAIFPGSALAKKPPAFVMAAELVETSRLWARDVASIQPEWAEELAGPLAKRTHSEPHWSTKRGAAMAHEKVLLYGVPIVADRPVLWAQVDPEGARDMFITHALVQGEWTTHHSFWNDNQRMLREAADLEARSRTRGLVVDDDALFAFYDERLPADVVSAAHFDKWWKDARSTTPDLLTFTPGQLVPDTDTIDPTMFPDAWPQGELLLPLTYQFEPGTDADGVTVHIPIEVLSQVTPDGFDWMVPGVLAELTTATIRALPKPVRRLLVPAPNTAREVVEWIHRDTPAWADIARAGDMAEPFQETFVRGVRETRGVDIPDDAWGEAAERLPHHLRMTFRVVESAPTGMRRGSGRDKGSTQERVLGESTDLVSLQRTLAERSRAAVQAAVQSVTPRVPAPSRAPSAPTEPTSAMPTEGGTSEVLGSLPSSIDEVPNLTSWPTDLPSGALPREVATRVGAMVVRGYPAIVPEGTPAKPVAALRVLADRAARDAAHATGVRRLLASEAALATKRVTTRWSPTQSLTLADSPYSSTDALVADLQFAAVWALTASVAQGGTGIFDAACIVDQACYDAALAHVRLRLEDEVYALVGRIAPALAVGRDLEVAISQTASLAMLPILADVRDHKAALLAEGFLSAIPPHRMGHLARYLRADLHRLDKAPSDPNRDAERMWQWRTVADEVETARAEHAAGRPTTDRDTQLERARWMLEELRVSLFAQQLGTDGPVSDKRIRKVLGG